MIFADTFYAIDQRPDGPHTCTIHHFKAFFMPHYWFACFKGPWQAVWSVFCISSIFKTPNHKHCQNVRTRFTLYIKNQMDHRHVQYAILKQFLCHIIGLHVSKVCGKRFCQYFVFYPFLSYFGPNFGEYFSRLLGTRSTYRCLQYLVLKQKLCRFCKF